MLWQAELCSTNITERLQILILAITCCSLLLSMCSAPAVRAATYASAISTRSSRSTCGHMQNEVHQAFIHAGAPWQQLSCSMCVSGRTGRALSARLAALEHILSITL